MIVWEVIYVYGTGWTALFTLGWLRAKTSPAGPFGSSLVEWCCLVSALLLSLLWPFVLAVAYAIALRYRWRPTSAQDVAVTRLYAHGAAREPAQAARMAELAAAGDCLFCGPPGGSWDVIERTGHWSIARNGWPYPGTRHHLLLSPHRHVTAFVDLTEAEHTDLRVAVRYAADRVGTDTFSLGIRSGDPTQTGASIAHLHAHLIFADDSGEPIRFRMSGRPRAET